MKCLNVKTLHTKIKIVILSMYYYNKRMDSTGTQQSEESIFLKTEAHIKCQIKKSSNLENYFCGQIIKIVYFGQLKVNIYSTLG